MKVNIKISLKQFIRRVKMVWNLDLGGAGCFRHYTFPVIAQELLTIQAIF